VVGFGARLNPDLRVASPRISIETGMPGGPLNIVRGTQRNHLYYRTVRVLVLSTSYSLFSKQFLFLPITSKAALMFLPSKDKLGKKSVFHGSRTGSLITPDSGLNSQLNIR
jgi:hypothetical protein